MTALPRRRITLLATLLLAAAAGCTSGPTRRTRETLTLAVRADVTGFFPNEPIVNEAYTFHINWNVLEGLVRFDRYLQPEPALAERWENPDDRTYVFHLRRGSRFSDGTPVRPEDVVASLEAALKRGWVNRDYLQAIESVRPVGALGVEIRTRAPYFILLSKLPFGLVLPAAALSRSPVPTVGTGPYRLESWIPGREIRLGRNPHFRGSAPSYARVHLIIVPEAQVRIDRLLRGEADVADHVPLERIDELSRRSDLRVIVRPTTRVLFLALRSDVPPFSDPRVREAVHLAIDREELIRRALAGRTQPSSQVVPPAVVGHNPRIRSARPDRLRARQLLAAAGHRAGLSLRLDGTFNRYVNDRQILDEVARQLNDVGIRVEVHAMDKHDFFPLIRRGESRLHLLGWACESGDAGDILDSLFHSPAGGTLGSLNTIGLSDSLLNRMIDESNRSPTSRDRRERLQAAIARVAELHVAVPLVVQTEAVALSRRVEWDPPPNLAFVLTGMRPAR